MTISIRRPEAPATSPAPGEALPRVMPVEVVAFAELPAARVEGLEASARLLGATVRVTCAPDPGPGAGSQRPAAVLLGARALLAAGDQAVAWARSLIGETPVLLFPEAAVDATILPEAHLLLTGRELPLGAPVAGAGYEVRRHPVAWPFHDIRLTESEQRLLPGLTARSEARPLIVGDAGPVLVWDDSERLAVTVQPPLESYLAGGQLRTLFRSASFLELLPLLQFLRAALGPAAWRTLRPFAAFIIDDPNLRSNRYGYVRYDRLVAAGDRYGFHTIIATAPLDLAKTRPRAAELFRRRPDRLSLVMHGVHHSHHEFAQHADRGHALARLADGLRRNVEHEHRHHIAVPPIMTFPFGRVTSLWLQAMREAGLTAAIASTAYPFILEQGLLGADYEMLPAEMGHQGFPVIPRFWPGTPTTDYVLQAFLGRPLIIYFHHDDYRRGLEPFTELADWINNHIDPQWCSAAQIAAGNVQHRTTPAGPAMRAFTNRCVVPAALDGTAVAVLKPAGDRGRDEHGWIDGLTAPLVTLPGLGVALDVPAASHDRLVAFGTRPTPGAPGRRGLPPIVAGGRRLLTEARDRISPFTRRLS